MTFPSVRSSAGGATGNGTTPSFDLPATISAGDLILVIAGTDNAAALTVPVGFTAITQDDAGAFQSHIFAKVAAGTEGGTSVTGTLLSSESSCHIALAIQDWSGNLSDVQASAVALASSTDQADPASVTASWGSDDNLFIAAAIADYWNQTATAFPTNYADNQLTEQHVNQFGGTQAVSVATRNLAAASDDPAAFTLFDPGTSQNNAAYTIVVKPAAATGPTLTDVNTNDEFTPGATNTLNGTDLSTTGGSIVINGEAQTITSRTATAIEFTGVRGGNPYNQDLTLTYTDADSNTATLTVQQVPASGFAVTAASPNTTDDASLWTGLIDTATSNPITIVDGDQALVTDPNNLGNLAVTPAGEISADTEGDFTAQIWLASEEVWGSDQTVTFSVPDEVAPTVSSVSATASGSYKAGDTLSLTVATNENVTVVTTGGTPSIPATIGSNVRQFEYASGSGTQSLVFSYTVQAGDNDANGISVGSSISLNGGTMKDAAGNDLVLTLNNVASTAGILVDTVKPVITPNGANPATVVVGGTYTDAGATATDDQDGSLGSVTGAGSVDTNTIGQYTVTYPGAGVVDSAGNVADDATRIVNVVAESPAPTPTTTRRKRNRRIVRNYFKATVWADRFREDDE